MARMRFYVSEKIGPRRAMTPEGFLVCYDVAIARTGDQKYGPDETPIAVGRDGFVTISRDADQIFREETLASFHGKPVTNDHPVDDVTPENWRQLAIGTVFNPRKGSDGMIVADLIITDRHGIELVNSGKVEVSCGYDADYEETGPGQGRQLNIIGNHVALVERARCGPRCSIGDQDYPEKPMSKKTTFADSMAAALRRAFKAKDAAELEEIEKEVKDSAAELSEPAGAVHVHIGSNPTPAAGVSDADEPDDEDEDKPTMKKVMDSMAGIKAAVDSMSERVAKLEESKTADAKPDEDEDEDSPVTDADILDEAGEGVDDVKGVKDSARFADSFRSTVSAAEIVAPGATARTFDAAAKPKTTIDAMHAMRLDAIEAARRDPVTAAFVNDSLGSKAFDRKRISVRDARTLFNSVAAFKRQINNSAPYRQAGVQDVSAQVRKGPASIADLNAMNAARKWN